MEIFRKEKGVLELRGDLHISESEGLRSALIVELTAASALAIDLSGVDSCDTASLQLLCSLQKSAQREGKKFRLSAPSAAMRETSAILGLSLEDLTNEAKEQ